MNPGEGNGKIYVGIPRERFYLPEFVDNRDAVLSTLSQQGLYIEHYQASGHRVDRNRDRIVQGFLNCKEEPEWLLFLDSDMEHPPDIGIRLVKHNKHIVGGLYFHRGKTHDPFVFRKSRSALDDYGRRQPMWAPMRDEVYDFLTQTRVPLVDAAVTIEGVDGLVKCDAIATGAMLIHRSVLESMKPGPWFEYTTGGNSEDLTFCANAKDNYGYDIWCDMCCISGHYALTPMGYSQFKMLYEARGFQYSTYGIEKASQIVGDFLKMPVEEAVKWLEESQGHEFGDYWREKYPDAPATPEEERGTYRDPASGPIYMKELMAWNSSRGGTAIRRSFMNTRGQSVIEIGAGIGSLTLQLLMQRCNVIAIEVNPVLRDFIKFRHQDLVEQMMTAMGKMTIMGDEWLTEEIEPVDTAVAIDVFEHLSLEDLAATLNRLGQVMKEYGRLYYHNNFGQQDLFPMHHNWSEQWDQLLRNAGFVRISDNEAVRLNI